MKEEDGSHEKEGLKEEDGSNEEEEDRCNARRD